MQEHSEREAQAETDFLSIYLPLFEDQPLNYRTAAAIKQLCLNDYKQLLVDRANRIQAKFDKVRVNKVNCEMFLIQRYDNLFIVEMKIKQDVVI